MSHTASTLSKSFSIGVVALATAAGSAQATFYSAASDANDKSFTFIGTAASGSTFHLADSGDTNRFNLFIDDNNQAIPAVHFSTRFVSNLDATFMSPTPISGSLTIFNYTVTGSFSYVDATTGKTLLTATLGADRPASMSVPGSGGTWFSTATIRGSDSFTNITYTATQDLIDALNANGHTAADFGLAVGDTVGPDDFAFDLTVLTSNGLPVTLGLTSFLPTTDFQAEGSFSGSSFSNVIPVPSTLALAGLGGLALIRRRRA